MEQRQHPISTRLGGDLVARLDALAARANVGRSDLVRRYVEEGLRRDDHPSIVFRDGPAGRRAGVIGAPDVWEVVQVVRDVGAAEAATWLGLPAALVAAAVSYATDYSSEIDDEIARRDVLAGKAAASFGASLGQ